MGALKAYRILLEKFEGKRLFMIPRSEWKDNIKMDR
jgi:hypothetical protein